MPNLTLPEPVMDVPAEQLDDLTQLFRALSDPVRLRILLLVTESERNVTTLCGATGLAQPTVSHHLGLLRSASLAQGRRSGKSIFYSAGPRIGVEPDGTILFTVGDAPAGHVRILPSATSRATDID